MIAFELMEGACDQRGFVTPDRTSLITSTHRVYSMMRKKTAMGDGRVDTDALLSTCNSAAKTFIGDYLRIAEDERSVISAGDVWRLGRGGLLPFVRQHSNAIRKSGVGVDSRAAAFVGIRSARARSHPGRFRPAQPH